MNKLEKMMKEDGWKLRYYENCGIKYFAFHKNGFIIEEKDIQELNYNENCWLDLYNGK